MTIEQKKEWCERLKAVCEAMEADKKQLLIRRTALVFIVSSSEAEMLYRPHLPQGTNIIVTDRKVWDFEHKFEYQDPDGKTHLLP